MSMRRVGVLNVIFLLTLLSSFIEPTSSAMQLEVQPGDTTLFLNHTINATFHCTCVECASASSLPGWSLQNEDITFNTDDENDRMTLAQRGIIFSSSSTSAVISIPDTVENNNTLISCFAFLFGSIEFSDPPVKVIIIIGPPPPPDPVIVITNNSSQLDIQWGIPYSHTDFPVLSYNIQIVNTSSGDTLESVLNYNDTSYEYTFDDNVQYCQIITVNVTAVSAVGSSTPGSVSKGIPIAPHPFQSGGVDVEVLFQNDENVTVVATITFMAPFICDYQTANYTLVIEDTTDPELLPLTRESAYSGGSRSIMEMITSGLQIDHNYALSISVSGEGFNTEVSTMLNFSSFIPTTPTATVYATTIFEQKSPDTTEYGTILFEETTSECCSNYCLSLPAAIVCILFSLYF